MELYLHIGTEKTGTTSVQKFFRANREVLAQNGIIYPLAPGKQNHMGLAASAQDIGQARGPLRKSLGIKTEAEARTFRAPRCSRTSPGSSPSGPTSSPSCRASTAPRACSRTRRSSG